MFTELSLEDNLKIDSLCDAFETEWTPESSLIFKPYLDQCAPHLHRGAVQELIKVDLELRFSNGLAIAPDLYQDQLPEFSDVIQKTVESSKVELDTLLFPQQASEKVESVHEAKPDATTELPEEHFGRFIILKELGKGAFGTVYLAQDPLLDRKVALKLPRLERRDTEGINRFLSEAQIAAQLHHPNIVAVWERGEIKEQFYISSAYVKGETLEDCLKTHPPDLKQKVIWIRDLALALQYAHEQNIIHRDIKPANIQVNEHHQPMIMDFGLAKRTNLAVDQTTDGQVMGTPAYMSPEQARGIVADIGPETDQYSLGAVFYQILMGEPRLTGTAYEIIKTLQNYPAPPTIQLVKQQIPADLIAVCQKMLQPVSSDRYESSLAASDDLTRWLDGRSVSVRKISQTERIFNWARRNKVVSSLLGLVFAILSTSLLMISLALFEASDAREAAEDNLTVARTQEAIAVNEKKKAEIEKEKAEISGAAQRIEASQSKLLLAGYEIRAGRFYEALSYLSALPKPDRNWVWKLQSSRIPKEICRIDDFKKYNFVSPRVVLSPDGKLVSISLSLPADKTYHHPRMETSIFDAQTGKFLHEIQINDYHIAIAMTDGFTTDSRYLIILFQKSFPLGPDSTLGVFDIQQNKIIKYYGPVRNAHLSPFHANEIVLQRNSKEDSKQVEYLTWNFLTDKKTDFGSGPYVALENFSVNSGQTEIAFRSPEKVDIKLLKEGKSPFAEIFQRLNADHHNLSIDQTQIVGRLQDSWYWKSKRKTVVPGKSVIVELPSKLVTVLENDPAVASLFDFSFNFSFSDDNKYAMLNASKSTSMLYERKQFCWWNRKSGEYVGKAIGQGVSRDGKRYASIENRSVVIRETPKHLRRFQSEAIESTLARWNPLHPSPRTQARPIVFYWKEKPWVFISHRNGSDIVDSERNIVTRKRAFPHPYYHIAKVAVHHKSGNIAYYRTKDKAEVLSLRTGKIIARLPCGKFTSNAFLAFHPDGTKLIGGDAEGLIIWSIAKQNIIEKIPHAKCKVGIQGNMHFNANGKFLSVFSTGYQSVILEKDTWVDQAQKISEVLFKISLSPDGSLLANADINGQISIFDFHSGKVIHQIETDAQYATPVFHPTQPLLIVGRNDGRLLMYSTKNWRLVFDEALPVGRVEEIKFSESGDAFAVSVETFTTRRWFEFSILKHKSGN